MQRGRSDFRGRVLPLGGDHRRAADHRAILMPFDGMNHRVRHERRHRVLVVAVVSDRVVVVRVAVVTVMMVMVMHRREHMTVE